MPELAAVAQEQEVGESDARDIDSIVVTAQRLAQTLVEVPMSVTAIQGDELEVRGMTNFLDYAFVVPSLSFGFNGAEARGSRNTIAIRGVSGTDTTGYHINDTPIPYGVDPHLFDIERVEILRGPQGTLYGSGSMGGTVKIIADPAPGGATAFRLYESQQEHVPPRLVWMLWTGKACSPFTHWVSR